MRALPVSRFQQPNHRVGWRADLAKDRNTIAKRQREVEKKRKAEEKRERRSRRKSDTVSEDAQKEPGLSDGEVRVLTLFRKYLMTPGQMLCLNANDVESMGDALTGMVSGGLLVPEEMRGGYSLTRKGFEAMNEMARE